MVQVARFSYHKDDTISTCIECTLSACIKDSDFTGLETDCPLIQAKQGIERWWIVPDKYVSMSEAARRLDLPTNTLRNWIKTGRCPAQKTSAHRCAPYQIPISWVESQSS